MPITKLRPSFTFTEDRLAQLRAVVPEAFSDGKINWDVLREALGEHVEDEESEHFGLFWPGKREARRLASLPSKGTLVPARGEGVNEDKTRNIFVEGENLEVLKILLRSYAGRVKSIYVDPPYNTGNDFVYKDDYKDPLDLYLRLTGQLDPAGELLTTNPQSSGRYHSNWMNMMWPRLQLARQLLREDGVMFISVDDHECHHLRVLMNEVFGEENFMGILIWKRRQNVDSRAKTGLSIDHEYLLVYRNPEASRLRGQEKDLTKYQNPDNDPRGPWSSDNLVGLATKAQRPNLHYNLVDPATGIDYGCPEAGWRYSRDTMARLIDDGRIIWPASATGRPRLRRYLYELADEFTGLSSVLDIDVYSSQATKELKDLFDGRDVLDFPKPVTYLQEILRQATSRDGEDIVMDFFAGSCTTAEAVIRLNMEDQGTRRFVVVQLAEPTGLADLATVADIGKERLRRAIRKLQSEAAGPNGASAQHLDLGFKVFKLARSHFREWWPYRGDSVGAYQMRLTEAAKSPLVDGWEKGDVLVEIVLQEGFPLDSTVKEEAEFRPSEVHSVRSEVRAFALWICLDERIGEETASRLFELPREDVFVCLDSALTDELKMRLGDAINLHVI